MYNYHEELVDTLSAILPTHYEMFLHRGLETPCISYMELNNSDAEIGDTIGYSYLEYQIKVWSNRIADLQEYALKIDAALRPLGWTRVSSRELYDNESTMMQKILTYRAKALEEFN